MVSVERTPASEKEKRHGFKYQRKTRSRNIQTSKSSTIIDGSEEIFNGKILHSPYDAHGNVFNNNQHSSSIINNNNNNSNGVSHIRNKNALNSDRFRRPGLNIHAKEFVSCQGGPSLHHSMSSSSVHMFHQGKRNLQHSKSGAEIKQEGIISSSKVHFAERKDNDPEAKLGMTNRNMQSKASLESYGSSSIHNPIKRSKSLGSVDLRQPVSEESLEPLAKIGPLSKEVQKLLSDAVNDPNKLSARQLMDAVRHIIVRVIETSRYSEPGAQICIRIIQREKGETFLETLLNTCQEYYQERQRLLRSTQNTPYSGGIVSYPRWIAYMSFLNEMYTQLKRRHNQLMTQQMKNNETPPGIHLLTLLAQCCNVCLQESVINSLSETECLFFVLTAVGKDIELKLPQHMARVMCAARDAFLSTVHLPAVRKTLLQLIEMHAARWNLSAPAVMYYYPGCCPTK
ncbi:MIF4G domain-containing protein B [Armadillidium vulgare]|nr:MIF4G domain-containing protein B [Armadillidium vulgare]